MNWNEFIDKEYKNVTNLPSVYSKNAKHLSLKSSINHFYKRHIDDWLESIGHPESELKRVYETIYSLLQNNRITLSQLKEIKQYSVLLMMDVFEISLSLAMSPEFSFTRAKLAFEAGIPLEYTVVEVKQFYLIRRGIENYGLTPAQCGVKNFSEGTLQALWNGWDFELIAGLRIQTDTLFETSLIIKGLIEEIESCTELLNKSGREAFYKKFFVAKIFNQTDFALQIQYLILSNRLDFIMNDIETILQLFAIIKMKFFDVVERFELHDWYALYNINYSRFKSMVYSIEKKLTDPMFPASFASYIENSPLACEDVQEIESTFRKDSTFVAKMNQKDTLFVAKQLKKIDPINSERYHIKPLAIYRSYDELPDRSKMVCVFSADSKCEYMAYALEMARIIPSMSYLGNNLLQIISFYEGAEAKKLLLPACVQRATFNQDSWRISPSHDVGVNTNDKPDIIGINYLHNLQDEKNMAASSKSQNAGLSPRA